eukprot:371741-Rhodomonas_salina.1
MDESQQKDAEAATQVERLQQQVRRYLFPRGLCKSQKTMAPSVADAASDVRCALAWRHLSPGAHLRALRGVPMCDACRFKGLTCTVPAHACRVRSWVDKVRHVPSLTRTGGIGIDDKVLAGTGDVADDGDERGRRRRRRG